MEPLKGSGKVAMISAWKTSVKEALDCEALPGRVVDMSRTMKKVQVSPESLISPDLATTNDPEIEKVDLSRDSQSSGNKNVDDALHSNMFLDDVLGGEVSKMLQKAEIMTAAELFNLGTISTTTPLYHTLMDADIVDGLTSCIALIDQWRKDLRQKLDEIGKTPAPTPSINSVQKRKAPVEISADTKDHIETTTTPSPVSSSASKVATETLHSLYVKDRSTSKDAISILSALSRTFLATIGIHTAHEFLSTRSTDIAVEFKDWRIAEGKPGPYNLSLLFFLASTNQNLTKAAVVPRRTRAKGPRRHRISEWLEVDGQEKGKRHGTVSGVTAFSLQCFSCWLLTVCFLYRISLSEMEPQTRGSWTNNLSGRGSRKKASIDKDDSKSLNLPAVETLPSGNGLAADRHELFAVQHRGRNFSSFLKFTDNMLLTFLLACRFTWSFCLRLVIKKRQPEL
jgi:hypothetical protein